jgi:hypothetical protein
VLGCICFVHIHGPTRDKLDPRALRYIYVGYSPTHKGYKWCHPPSRKCFVLMDVTFFELQPYFSSTHTSFQRESSSEEKFFMNSTLPMPTFSESQPYFFHPPTLLFKGRVQVKRSFIWIVLYMSPLICQSKTNSNHLLMSLLLMGNVNHRQWSSREFTQDAKKIRLFQILFAKHLTLTKVIVLRIW